MEATRMDWFTSFLQDWLPSDQAKEALGGAAGGVMAAIAKHAKLCLVIIYLLVGMTSAVMITDGALYFFKVPPEAKDQVVLLFSCVIGVSSMAALKAVGEINWADIANSKLGGRKDADDS